MFGSSIEDHLNNLSIYFGFSFSDLGIKILCDRSIPLRDNLTQNFRPLIILLFSSLLTETLSKNFPYLYVKLYSSPKHLYNNANDTKVLQMWKRSGVNMHSREYLGETAMSVLIRTTDVNYDFIVKNFNLTDKNIDDMTILFFLYRNTMDLVYSESGVYYPMFYHNKFPFSSLKGTFNEESTPYLRFTKSMVNNLMKAEGFENFYRVNKEFIDKHAK